ncbi:MAG: DHH family phosphoesterase [Christensenellaceae bacterium]|jgi:phosphoesterase RecJ-like protein|nr:DHH family phosphoesterase [Christensenellaceae bacterium]
MAGFDALRAALQGARRVALFAHLSPDGDTIGSCLGAMHALKGAGLEAHPFCADLLPPDFGFLEGFSAFSLPFKASGSFDLALALDVSSPDRLGSARALFESTPARFCVDHHLGNVFDCGKIVDEKAAATAEIVLELVQALNLPLTKSAAMALYTGLSTDTGNFSFESVREGTLRAAALCVKCGAEPETITRTLYRTRNLSQIKLLGAALSKLETHAAGQIALIALSEEDRLWAGASESDYEGIVNYAAELKGVLAAALLSERPSGLRCSLRCQAPVDSSKIAALFGGGGHARAAGMTLQGFPSLQTAKSALLHALKGALKKDA